MSRISSLGIVTAMTPREADMLQQVARGHKVTEIGSLLGYSTIKLAQVAAHVIAIDPHRDYPSYNPAPTLKEFLSNLDRLYVTNKVTPVVDIAQNAFPLLHPTYMTFIDATGAYTDTSFCLNHCFSQLIAVHDYGRRGCEGATKAVDEFIKHRNLTCQVIDTLAVIS